jgi:hypothetical protein
MKMDVINPTLYAIIEKLAEEWSAANAEIGKLFESKAFPHYMKTNVMAGVQQAVMTKLFQEAQKLLSHEELEQLGVTDEMEKMWDAGMVIFRAYRQELVNIAIDIARR